jgi:Zn-dependent M16 (insulinase) family peptidase
LLDESGKYKKVPIPNSFADAMMGSNITQHYSLGKYTGEINNEKMLTAITGNQQQQSNSTIEQELQQHHQQDPSLNSTFSDNNNIHLPISSIKSGSNYLEAEWHGLESSSARVFIQLDGDIVEELRGGRHIIMIGVFPFLHR